MSMSNEHFEQSDEHELRPQASSTSAKTRTCSKVFVLYRPVQCATIYSM